MTPIYLSKLEISDFRAFGHNFSMDFPAEPSVTLVYGMNGLGKTTFFEAMEWALTNDVRRLSSSKQVRKGKLHNFLTRHEARKLNHRVSMSFNDDLAPLIRTHESHPDLEDMLKRFKSQEWQVSRGAQNQPVMGA